MLTKYRLPCPKDLTNSEIKKNIFDCNWGFLISKNILIKFKKNVVTTK